MSKEPQIIEVPHSSVSESNGHYIIVDTPTVVTLPGDKNGENSPSENT